MVLFKFKILVLFLAILFTLSCSKDYFKEAEVLQKQGKYLEAARYYEAFADKNPEDVLADISLYRAALIYSEKFEMCDKSLKIFEKIVREYPKSQFHSDAYLRAFICPDYFPLNKIKKWEYGDSQSGGKNAREIIWVKKQDEDGNYLADYLLYAGNKLIVKKPIKYSLKNMILSEISGKTKRIILKYPIKRGMQWSDSSGDVYKVADKFVQVKVRAGIFENCLKITQENFKSGYKMVFYYASGKGKILTSMETQGKENRIMELIKYE